MSRFTESVVLVAVLVGAGCAPPRVAALPGSIAPVQQLPRAELPAGAHKIVFEWELRDGEIISRGDGVARVAPPDSIRLDFFLGGGFGSGGAIMIGDTVLTPGPDAMRQFIPSRPLLWASFGRFLVPAERDTVVRVDAALVRADIGTPVQWRVTFRGDSLARLERVADGRLQEWVERFPDQKVQYRNEAARRSLSLTIVRSDAVAPFDPSIWHF